MIRKTALALAAVAAGGSALVQRADQGTQRMMLAPAVRQPGGCGHQRRHPERPEQGRPARPAEAGGGVARASLLLPGSDLLLWRVVFVRCVLQHDLR